MFQKNLIFITCGLLLSSCAVSCLNQSEQKTETQHIADSEQVKSANANNPIDKSNLQSEKSITKPSNVIEILKERKRQNPKISPKELADYGNELAEKQGYNYIFENCKLAEQAEKEAEQNTENVDYDTLKPYDYKMTDVKGSQIAFQFMNKDFGHPCFCVIDVPTLKVNRQTMTVIADGKAIELKRPEEFYLEEFVLVDKTLKKEIRKWLVPIDATPLGISDNGKNIYFEYSTDEHFEDLTYEISEDGTIQFVAKNDKKINKGKELKGYPNYSEISYRQFNTNNKNYIVKFSYPCT